MNINEKLIYFVIISQNGRQQVIYLYAGHLLIKYIKTK